MFLFSGRVIFCNNSTLILKYFATRPKYNEAFSSQHLRFNCLNLPKKKKIPILKLSLTSFAFMKKIVKTEFLKNITNLQEIVIYTIRKHND